MFSQLRRSLPVALLLLALHPAPPAAFQEGTELTVARVLQLLKERTPAGMLLNQIQRSRSRFDLTIDDVIRLRKAGATPAMVALMAGTAAPPVPAAPEPAAEPVPPARPSPDSLSVKQVLKLYRKAMPIEEITAQIAARGLREVPVLDELLAQRERGLPAAIVRSMAGAGPQPAAGATVAAVPRATAPATGAGEAPVTAEEPDEAAPPPTEDVEDEEDDVAERGARLLTPAGEGVDRLLVASVPAGARVYISSLRTRRDEAFDHDYLVGRTPLALTLEPGDYQIGVQKEAGAFEEGLLPAWRTIHDLPSSRSILDDARLTFDPDACCLPGTLEPTVNVHPVPGDQPLAIIGDQFDGLPPFLFDGEQLQILDVRKTRITRSMKLYALRKNPGQSRVLIATFVPAEGDPLSPESPADDPLGEEPFAPWLAQPGLEFLSTPQGIVDLAAALGVETQHLGDAIPMLRRAGKAILHQQIEGGVRLAILAVDDDGRLRLTDQKVRPADPFAPPPPKKKKKTVAPPPPPPPLPLLERSVIPGLGLPRLVIENTRERGLGLALGDGELCFAPAKTTRECVIDPGTHDVRVLGGPTPAEGQLHFSYHARYSVTF